MLDTKFGLKAKVFGLFAIAASVSSGWPRRFSDPRSRLASAAIRSAVAAAAANGVTLHVGNVLSADNFYDDGSDGPDQWKKMGVLAVEMEAAGLYCTAAYTGKRALAICSISDNLVNGTELSADERQTTFTNMMKIGLEAAVKMAQRG